ncbi:MAG: 2-oxo acid dehydrogenase subunit E2 [Anaerolineales bacterium]|nr:2-oxo acid dehydrogenase subunit E2 [Anaerolineales bacterium]
MATEMIMPKVDMDQETGTVVEWLKGNGQQVEEGEIIMVMETDKIAIDVEAPGTGILDGISANPGDVVPIGTVIAYILAEGEELPKKPIESTAPTLETPTAAPSADPREKEISATPVARNMAAAHRVDLAAVDSTGTGGKITKADVQAVVSRATKPVDPRDVYATPSARRTARIEGVNLGLIQGSGPGSRIQLSDVKGYLTSKTQADFAASAQIQAGEVIPLIGMRRTIAERLTASYQSIPHIQFTVRVDMTNFFKARNDYNDLALKRGDDKVSVTAVLVKLVSMVLIDHPWVNSSLIDDKIILHKDINIGVAVALEKGLIVPVIKNADQKGISLIASETNELITRAREEKLNSADVKGGTFTITNLGPFGVEQFNAIINPPEAGILAVGSTTSEVVALPDGTIAARPIMRLTLSADHRVVDGAVAARFIGDLKTTLENPILMNY